MAKTVYVNKFTGNNSWDGLSPTYVSGTNGPKKTILGARAATASGDLVLIAPGVYLESSSASFSASADTGVLYRRDPSKAGKVIIDFENSPLRWGSGNGYPAHWYNDRAWFLDLHFRNPYSGTCFFAVGFGNPGFLHCVFYDRDGGVKVGRGITRNNSGNPATVLNCSFYNLDTGLFYFNPNRASNNYFVNVTTPHLWMGGTMDYNAFPGNTEPNGIDTSTGANPGFTNAAGEDFTLDSTTTPADWQTFMTAGYRGGRIGAFGMGGMYYNSVLPQLRFMSPSPTSAQGNPNLEWENEGPSGTGTYIKGTPGDVIEDSGNNYRLTLDQTTTPDATGGRVRSEVFDMVTSGTLLPSIVWAGVDSPATGGAFDVDGTLPFQEEYRSSDTQFSKGDVSPAWQKYTSGEDLSLSGDRYFQFRVEFRTIHTNA